MALTAQDLIKMYSTGGSAATTAAIQGGVSTYKPPVTPPVAPTTAPKPPMGLTATQPTVTPPKPVLNTSQTNPQPTYFSSPTLPNLSSNYSATQTSTPNAMTTGTQTTLPKPTSTSAVIGSTVNSIANLPKTVANVFPTVNTGDPAAVKAALEAHRVEQGRPAQVTPTTSPTVTSGSTGGAKTLYEYYKGAMPSLEARGAEYERLGLGTAADYVRLNKAGDPKPNIALLAALVGASRNTTSTSQTGSQTGSASVTSSTGSTPKTTEKPVDWGVSDTSGVASTSGETPKTGETGGAPKNATVNNEGIVKQILEQTQMSEAEQALRQQSGDLKAQLAEKLGQNAMNPIPLEFQTGKAQTLQNMAAQKQAALEAQIQSYAQQRGISAEALRPLMQQVSPGTGVFDVTTGKEIVSGMGGLQGINNYTQGNALKQQANQIKTTLNTADGLANQAAKIMQSNGALNPVRSAPINDFLQNIQQYTGMVGGANSADLAQLHATVNEMNNQMTQILQTSGTPSGAEGMVAQLGAGSLDLDGFFRLYKQLRENANIRIQNLDIQSNGYLNAGKNVYNVPYNPNENVNFGSMSGGAPNPSEPWNTLGI